MVIWYLAKVTNVQTQNQTVGNIHHTFKRKHELHNILYNGPNFVYINKGQHFTKIIIYNVRHLFVFIFVSLIYTKHFSPQNIFRLYKFLSSKKRVVSLCHSSNRRRVINNRQRKTVKQIQTFYCLLSLFAQCNDGQSQSKWWRVSGFVFDVLDGPGNATSAFAWRNVSDHLCRWR